MPTPVKPKDRHRTRSARHARGGRVRMAALIGGVMVAVCGGAQPAVAQQSAPSEHQIKAAFLINFPKYVAWPEAISPRPDSSIIIATLGESGVAEELRRMVPGKTFDGHPIIFKALPETEGAPDCHILFIPDSARRRLPALLETLERASILTVGESDDFLGLGGMINLVRKDRKIRLQVSLDAAKPAGVKISSKLLSVADVVRGK